MIYKYSTFEQLRLPRPKRRVKFITSQCRDKNVLDVGALDETAFQSKKSNNNWLHIEIAKVARYTLGVDNSSLIPPEGLKTTEKSRIDKLDISSLPDITTKFSPEIIIAGEIIEHIDRPLDFLKILASTSGSHVLITTPNACSIHNFLMGIIDRESTHKDHLFVFSPKTINTICMRAGFSKISITPYHAEFTELIEECTGAKRITIKIVQKIINIFEYLFPALSGGLIVELKV